MAASGLNAMDPRRTPEKVLTGHPDPADLVASFEDDERFAACSPKFQRRDQPRETRASCAGNRLRARPSSLESNLGVARAGQGKKLNLRPRAPARVSRKNRMN